MRKIKALVATVVLVAAVLVPTGSAQAWTAGSTICHGSYSERSLLTTITSGQIKNIKRGSCVKNADKFFVPAGCRALVNMTSWRTGPSWQRVKPFVYYGVGVDC